MTDQMFMKDYDITVFVFSVLLQGLHQEDDILAGHCIRWLATIIQSELL